MTSSIGKNFSLLMASNLLAPVFSMVLVLAISRTQGVEALGKYSFVMTIFVLGQSCGALGLPIIITREVARARVDAGRYFLSACAVTAAVLLPVVLVALPTLRGTMADRDLAWAVWLVLLALVPSIVTVYAEAILLAFERAQDFVAVGLVENVARAAIGTVLVLSGHGVTAIAVAIVALRLLASVAFLLILRAHGVRLAARVDPGLCRRLAREIPVVGSIPIVNAVYARMDVFLLTWLGTWSDVGLYSAAVRLVDVARTIAPAYARALYPVLSRLRASSPAKFAFVARQSIRDVLLVVVPISLLLSGLAQPLIALIYGPNLESAAGCLRVLAWTLVPVTLATTLAQMLFADGKQAIDLRVNLMVTVAAVALNAVLIPRWGAVGASVATLLAATLYASLQYLWVRWEVTDPDALLDLAKLTGLSVLALVLIVGLTSLSYPISALCGFGTYVAGTMFTGVCGPADWARLRTFVVTRAVEIRRARS